MKLVRQKADKMPIISFGLNQLLLHSLSTMNNDIDKDSISEHIKILVAKKAFMKMMPRHKLLLEESKLD